MLTFDNAQEPDTLSGNRENSFSALLQSQNLPAGRSGGFHQYETPSASQVPELMQDEVTYTQEQQHFIDNIETAIVEGGMNLENYLSGSAKSRNDITDAIIFPGFKSFTRIHDLRDAGEKSGPLSTYLKGELEKYIKNNPDFENKEQHKTDISAASYLLVAVFQENFRDRSMDGTNAWELAQQVADIQNSYAGYSHQ
jgi:hypothetical protein